MAKRNWKYGTVMKVSIVLKSSSKRRKTIYTVCMMRENIESNHRILASGIVVQPKKSRRLSPEKKRIKRFKVSSGDKSFFLIITPTVCAFHEDK